MGAYRAEPNYKARVKPLHEISYYCPANPAFEVFPAAQQALAKPCKHRGTHRSIKVFALGMWVAGLRAGFRA